VPGTPVAPVRLPRWPESAPQGPDFAAIRAEFDVPEEFPPEVLDEAGRRAATPPLPELDDTEAWLLRRREGQEFSAVVVGADDGPGPVTGTVVLDDLAVRGRCTGHGLTPGTRVRVRLQEADPVARTVRFTTADVQ
jgi:exoribonuclease R